MNSFRVSKAIKQPQRLVRLASTGSLKDKTIGVIGMGHVGKYFLVLQSNLVIRNFLVITKLFTNANFFTIY